MYVLRVTNNIFRVVVQKSDGVVISVDDVDYRSEERANLALRRYVSSMPKNMR